MNPRNFFAELKRRNVYKVAAAYTVVAWLLIQAASIVFPTFDAPIWTMKVLIAILAIGFPVAVVLAWAFEITPEGIVRADDVPPNESITRRTGRKLVAATAVLAAIAAGLLFFQLARSKSVHLENGALATPNSDLAGSRSIPEKSIAVLPFENLSSDKENSYFADGIQDEILTKLASIADLKVISRTSTAKYKSKPEDLRTVSQQLGVATVLEGSVQKSGDKVRVNVQLIDARVDTHLWAKSYDGDAKDIFGMESQVSQQVADALRAKLSPSEADVLAKAPTQNPEAYDFFLKAEYAARQAQSLLAVDWFARAETGYRNALERDPNFALAAARLVENRLLRHWFVEPLSPAELEDTKKIVDVALASAPDLAEAHVALGTLYYWGNRDYEPALAEFHRAIDLQPGSARALQLCGYVDRRQGRWEQSQAELAQAAELDPRDATIPQNMAATCLLLREWQQAKGRALRALAIDPQLTTARRVLVDANLNGDGNITEAKRVVADMPPGMALSNNAVRGNVIGVIDERTYLRVMERDFAGAMKETEGDHADPARRIDRLAARAAIRVLAGDAASATAEGEEARTLLETKLRERPGDGIPLIRLAWVYLALGREGDALRTAHDAARSLPIEKDTLAGPDFTAGEAQIQARAGQPREAITTLRYLLSIPAGQVISIQRLKIDPVWDPIRNDPEFQRLLAGKEQIGPNK
jgi:TolB-like protein/Tfp pilus assembly protein PilF